MQQFREVQIDGLGCKRQNLKINTVFDQEPMKLLKDKSDVINGGGSDDDAGSGVLDQLKFMDELKRETKQNGVTVINAGCDQGVNKTGSAVGCEGWAEDINIT